ncbi:MAG: hypothetical protein H6718_09640 [Polyangiaceae bacterium]|nr:hypothetical protein [Myxococcales bacterium]MCB9585650.1 hypothetical protein [Polyangiaceae bacterium]
MQPPMPAAAPAQPKSSKLPILLFIAGAGALLFSFVLGGVGGYFHYQANKAYRAEAIAIVYVGSSSSITARLREKGDNLSMIRNVAWGTSFLMGLVGIGGFIGGFVTRSKKPAATPPGMPGFSGQGYQPDGYANPNSGVPTAPSPGAPPASAAVSSNPYGPPPAGFGGPEPSGPPAAPPGAPPPGAPPPGAPPSFQPTAASPQPAPPLPPPGAPPAPPSPGKFGGTMLMPEVDPTKK